MKTNANATYDEMPDFDKQQLKIRDKEAHKQWLRFIIAEKRQLAVEYKDKKMASKIYLREAMVYEEELRLAIGQSPLPDSHCDLSETMAKLYETLYSKQSLLIIGKGSKGQDKYEADVRLAELEIQKQERIEGISKELSAVPF